MSKIREINIYPIKGMQGISLNTSLALNRGFSNDRRLMLVDERGNFVSQRTVPSLTSFKLKLEDSQIQVSYINGAGISIPTIYNKYTKMNVTVWGTTFNASLMPDEYHHYFSDCLGTKVKLVSMQEDDIRYKELKENGREEVSFADGYPYSILGLESYNDLNSRLEIPVPINRFRTNIILDTSHPYEEDEMDRFILGNAEFKMINSCIRCKVITIDQDSGSSSTEPTATLAKYRKSDGGIIFGMNAICTKNGEVSVGNSVVFHEE